MFEEKLCVPPVWMWIRHARHPAWRISCDGNIMQDSWVRNGSVPNKFTCYRFCVAVRPMGGANGHFQKCVAHDDDKTSGCGLVYTCPQKFIDIFFLPLRVAIRCSSALCCFMADNLLFYLNNLFIYELKLLLGLYTDNAFYINLWKHF